MNKLYTYNISYCITYHNYKCTQYLINIALCVHGRSPLQNYTSSVREQFPHKKTVFRRDNHYQWGDSSCTDVVLISSSDNARISFPIKA